jgi:iron-sulfur cluster repair protein YtfE (RIC family)
MAKPASLLPEDVHLIRHDHQSLYAEVRHFEKALDDLKDRAATEPNLACVSETCRLARHLAGTLPGHMRFEDKTLFPELAKRDPAAKAFAKEMQRQHDDLCAALVRISRIVQEFDGDVDARETIQKLIAEGQTFSRDIWAHVTAEEQELLRLQR